MFLLKLTFLFRANLIMSILNTRQSAVNLRICTQVLVLARGSEGLSSFLPTKEKLTCWLGLQPICQIPLLEIPEIVSQERKCSTIWQEAGFGSFLFRAELQIMKTTKQMLIEAICWNNPGMNSMDSRSATFWVHGQSDAQHESVWKWTGTERCLT